MNEPIPKPFYKRWKAVVGIISFVLILALLCFLIGGFNAVSTQFFITSLLSFLVLIVIAAQAEIYERQWKVMLHGLEQTNQLLSKIERQANIATAQAQMTREQITLIKQEIEQNASTLEVMKEQTRITEGQLDAMKAQTDLAIKEFEAQSIADRAYFDVTALRPRAENGQLIIDLVTKNCGNTPAYDFHFQLKASLEHASEVVWDPNIHSGSSNFIPANSDPNDISLKTFIPEHDWDNSIRNHVPVYLEGEYRYIDANGTPRYFRVGWTLFDGGLHMAQRYHHPYQPDEDEKGE